MFLRVLLACCLFLSCLIAAHASAEGLGSDTRLVLTGSSTVAPVALEIAKRFEKLHPGTRIDVQTGGSSRGVADARSGAADIGMASRALKANESDLITHSIARDGVGIIVNSANAIDTLSEEQIKNIFTGQIKNWQQVDGADKRITVVNKAEGHSTLELFLAYFNLKNSAIKAHVVIGDNQQGIKTVTGNPYAIGYVSIGAAEFEITNGAPLKLLPMASIPASVDNIRNGTFPLARPLNFVTRSQPTGLAKQFIEFAQSNAVNDIIEAQFFVPLAD